MGVMQCIVVCPECGLEGVLATISTASDTDGRPRVGKKVLLEELATEGEGAKGVRGDATLEDKATIITEGVVTGHPEVGA